MSQRSMFINDGYTEQGYLAEVENLHPAMRFTYRPALTERRSEIQDKLAKTKDGPEFDRRQAEELTKHLLSWNLVDESGQSIPMADHEGTEMPIKPVNILKLRNKAYQRLANIIIFGAEGGDTDPQWPAHKKAEHDSEELASALNGGNPRDAKTEGHEKNSGKG